MTFKYKTPDESTGFLLWKVTHQWQREIKRVLKKHDLTHTQFVILANVFWLSKGNDSLTQVTIAEHIEINIMMTSNVLRTLEQKKLIVRQAHQIDTRAKIIKTTKLGDKTLKRTVKEVESFDKKFFSKVNKLNSFNKELLSLLNNYSS